MILCDTHADTLYRLAIHPDEECDITLPRLKEGGVSVQTLAMYVGGSSKIPDIAKAFAAMEEKAEFLKTKGWKQLRDYREAVDGENAFILSVEGCDLLDNSLDVLYHWQEIGVRMAAITWNYENSLAVPACVSADAHLKPFGREAIREMYKLGIAPDTSHLNQQGFYDILEMGLIPLASHSCCRNLCDHRRNLTDDQLKALFEAGGYVGCNFYPYFLSKDGKATIETVCDHLIHMMELGGEKNIGFGSDFDGIECAPEGLTNPADFPALLNALRRRGVTEDQITAMAGLNLQRYYDRIDPQ